MRCFECDRQAVALCRSCLVGQCEAHLAGSQRRQARSGALSAGCSHPEARDAGGLGGDKRAQL
jgi:hypothetical protein